MPLYNCKTHSGLDYLITKLDDDLNPESTYILIPLDTERTVFSCDCPAGVRPTCRHRQMLPHFINAGRVNSGWVMDWDGGQVWRQYVGPFGDDGTIEYEPQEGYKPFASDAPSHTDLMVSPESIPDYDGEGLEQSTLAAYNVSSPSQAPSDSPAAAEPILRGGPSPLITRR